jgi:AraC-like DNA-binding protein
MRELTVAASVVGALMDLAVSKGAARRTLVERSGIDSTELADRDRRVAFSKYVALMRAGQDLCRDPALALHFGEVVGVAEISITHSVGGVTRLDEAVTQANRYSRLGVEVETIGTGDRFQLTRTGGQLWIVDARSNPNDFPELTESTFARMVCSSRRAFAGVSAFRALQVTHPEPAYRAEYDRIFQVPTVFGSGKNALQLDEALVATFRIPPPASYVTGVLRDHAEALLEKLDSLQSIRGQVESLLVPLLPTRQFGVEVIAAKMGLSRQTLFRKLKAEGVTFEQVLDALRHKTALHCLNGPGASVKQTARLVGFADPTAFSRAFKRWTGSTPSRYAARPDRSG